MICRPVHSRSSSLIGNDKLFNTIATHPKPYAQRSRKRSFSIVSSRGRLQEPIVVSDRL